MIMSDKTEDMRKELALVLNSTDIQVAIRVIDDPIVMFNPDLSNCYP